jgi:hypothetical protein
MIHIAHIDNGIVTNVSVWESNPGYGVDITGMEVGIGDLYDGQHFSKPQPPEPTVEELKQAITNAVQAHLDATARTRGYDGILSLASYASSTNPPFSAEGRAGLDWRDAVWGYCYGVLADVQAGTRTIPTAEELIAELPGMVWPA